RPASGRMAPVEDAVSREVRICVVGDELSAGVGDAKALGWAGRVVARTRFPQPAYVFPLAIPGETTTALSQRREAATARRVSPAPQPGERPRRRGVAAAADVRRGPAARARAGRRAARRALARVLRRGEPASRAVRRHVQPARDARAVARRPRAERQRLPRAGRLRPHGLARAAHRVARLAGPARRHGLRTPPRGADAGGRRARPGRDAAPRAEGGRPTAPAPRG